MLVVLLCAVIGILCDLALTALYGGAGGTGRQVENKRGGYNSLHHGSFKPCVALAIFH